MKYQIAEKFKSIQGEGVYTGTPMAFIRFVGCSIGKRICQHCDTDFEKPLGWQGGGEFTPQELLSWSLPYSHICLTGGEPLDQNLAPLLGHISEQMPGSMMVHVETSGTKNLGASEALTNFKRREDLWICVSPKPGFLEEVVMAADEVKVIVPGLGEITATLLERAAAHPIAPAIQQTEEKVLKVLMKESEKTYRWPTIEDALRWAHAGKTVFLQPRNAKFDVDHQRLRLVQDIIAEHPELRLSTQMHKILHVQ